MHIPDGYLAPQTTIPALAAMVPVWGVALRKVKKELGERQIPTLALCAAFAFVVMMFNAPVAGGSSAHAVGAVFISILLGPWAATVAVSVALLIQALVFGDGGILAFGINCLNMAVIMPFTGYLVYRLIGGRSKPGSGRSLAASFAGGFAGLNLAALCAAVELGIQPLLFHTASGQALYCPYPLSVSIPAMALAHLTVAGPIDGIVTAAGVAYLARFAPQMFVRRQPGAASPAVDGRPFWKRYRAFLIPLGALMLLTPIGLLASGTAWAEWDTQELLALKGYIPKGLAAMADRWHALLPDYSLGGTGEAAGYIISAAVGMLLIVGIILLMAVLIAKMRRDAHQP